MSQFNYLIDLHTAGSDVNDPISALMARLQQPQIVLHNSGQDGYGWAPRTVENMVAVSEIWMLRVIFCNPGILRSAAAARGVKAITVAIGNPQLFQNHGRTWASCASLTTSTCSSSNHPQRASSRRRRKLRCAQGGSGVYAYVCVNGTDAIPVSSYACRFAQLYTKTGVVLEVYGVNTFVRKGDLIVRIKNIFGNVVDEHFVPCSGIVSNVGKGFSVVGRVTTGQRSNPVAMTSDWIIHLGVIKKKGEVLPREAKENY
ncbi:hypothetical protein BC936DRAFT_136886 [Jimgerdemannia flammicorona]|uniref:Uncharacterized protein n=1 Tax=Jimgerdemannia flammicorona TaxID=994334 RepID=A0A433CYL3_9FUNG|nr:hypothetical protein BC936DRAFT_136886 [Jimgerdemannia flammicorona]